MADPADAYADWLRAWGNLWPTGFAAVWQGYSQWAGSMAAYQLGQSQVGQTPADEIWRHDRLRLLRYRPAAGPQHPIPVLCVPSLINRYYILDLLPDRSLVGYLVGRGLRVYMLDWGRPSPADATLTLDTHLADYLTRAIRVVLADAAVAHLSLLGYCMGGTFAAVYASLWRDSIANVINLAGPINYHDDGIFSTLTRADWFDADRLVASYGNIPAALLAYTFQMLRPTAQLLRALSLYERQNDPDYVRSFAAMQTWIFDQVDFPGEAFRRYIKALYQGNELVRGAFTLNGRSVDLAHLTSPLLTIASEHDETAPAPSVAILDELAGSRDKTLLLLKGPHVGMVAGSKAPRQLWPALADWLIPRSQP